MTDTATPTPAVPTPPLAETTPAPVLAAASETAAVASAVADNASTPAVAKTVATDVASAASDVDSGEGVSDLSASLIRTYTPALVGGALTLLGGLGLKVPASEVAVATAGGSFVIGSLYYTVVRLIEKRFPKAGWLLGKPQQPTYTA
jgi:hypothetical protein